MIWNLTVPQQRRVNKKTNDIAKTSTNDDSIVVEEREAEMLLMHAAEKLEVLRSKQLSTGYPSTSPKESSSKKTHKRKTSFGSWFSNVFSSSSSTKMEDCDDIDSTDEAAATAMNKMVISIPTDENIILSSSPSTSPVISPKRSSSASRRYHSLCCKRLKRARLATAHVIRSLSPAPSEIRTRFESFCDECYCEECCGKNYSNDKDHGWCELGLHVDSRTYVEGKDVFNKWNVAYHGFPHQHLLSIVLNDLAFPGDRIKVGDKFVCVKKPRGHSRDHTAKRNIFMSPSIHCAGCPLVYAIPLRIDNFESSGDTVWVQFAMKVRVDPKCYTKRANNIDARLWPRDMPFDKNIPNSEIEWFTDTRNCVVSSALMVRVSKTNPIEDTRMKIAMFKSLNPTSSRTTDATTIACHEDEDEETSVIVVDQHIKKKENIFFGVLRKRASQHLEKMLASLQDMYAKTKKGGSDQGKFVKEMCRMMGPDVLEEVLDEVELKRHQQDDDEEMGEKSKRQEPPPPPPRPSPSSFVGLFEDVNKRDETGCSALHWAASHGEIPTMRMLLRAGADVKAVDAFGKTALHLLCRGGKTNSSSSPQQIPVGEKRHYCSFVEEEDLEPLQKKSRRNDSELS